VQLTNEPHPITPKIPVEAEKLTGSTPTFTHWPALFPIAANLYHEKLEKFLEPEKEQKSNMAQHKSYQEKER